MLGKTYCCCVNGLAASLVTIEVRLTRGIKYYMIGLAEQSVKESLHRVESALQTSGWKMPRQKLVINLSPPDIRKSGSHYDLAIAIAILKVSGQIKNQDTSDLMLIGGLSLNGVVQPAKGLLTMIIEGKKRGVKRAIVPFEQVVEASLVKGMDIIAVKNLTEVIEYVNAGTLPKKSELVSPVSDDKIEKHVLESINFSGLKGQNQARRALEIAASGGHNVLMIGPPGSGKTLLSKMFLGILPPLEEQEAMESWQVYSLSGYAPPGGNFSYERPFRAPHHTIGYASLVGGGASPQPGEISLAHRGLLFMDELPEFKRSVLEALRQPLENKQILISRSRSKVLYPADFIFIGAMNPCPCGYHNHPFKTCSCSSYSIQRYLSKISGPLLDRIDIHLEIPPVLPIDLKVSNLHESSEKILERVKECRFKQANRFQQEDKIKTNAEMTNRMVSRYCKLSAEAAHLLERSNERILFSARSYERILKVSRTIADIEDSKDIEVAHVAEALVYRSLDRKNWIEKN